MNTTLKLILLSISLTLTAGIMAILFSPNAHAGLSLSDAGEASCNGTLGGGQLSKAQLDDICRSYKENAAKNDSSALVIEIIKSIALIGLGGTLGFILARNRKNHLKK